MKATLLFALALGLAWALPLGYVASLIAYPAENMDTAVLLPMGIAFGIGGLLIGFILALVYLRRPQREHTDYIETSSTFKTAAEQKVIDWSFVLSVIVGAALGFVFPNVIEFPFAPRDWYIRVPLIALAALSVTPAAALFAMKPLRKTPRGMQ